MKKALNIVIVMLFLSAFSIAQDPYRELGKIGKEFYEMEFYEKDKDAEALVLHDLGQSSFQQEANNFSVVFKRHTRIKIFSEAGLSYAEVEIPIYREGNIYERVTDLEGYTYNYVNGRVHRTELDPSDSYIEKVNEYWSVKKFVMPNVQPGSIIEYTYSLRTQDKFNLRDWEFQRRIPTLYSEYTVRMVPFYAYAFILQGASSFDVQRSAESTGMKQQFGSVEYKDLAYVYGMRDVPAFRGEEFITSINDYIVKMDFQLSKVYNLSGQGRDIMTTWEEMVNDYWKKVEFGKYIKKSEKLYDDVIGDGRFKELEDSARICEIVGVVKSNVDWNGSYARSASCKPKELVDRKTGNVADVNLFLTGLLRGAGFNAYPVMLSTRGHGKIWPDYPFSHFFNYIIAAVETGDGYILVDATSPLCADNRLPPRCFNDRGLLFDEKEPRWVYLKFSETSEIRYDFDISIGPGKLQADVLASSTEYESYRLRNAYGDETGELIDDLEKKYINTEIDSVEILQAYETGKPYIYKYDLSGPPEQINNKIYIAPFLGETETENPLKQQTRNHPVDMIYPKSRRYHSEIKIPEDYTVDHMPEPVMILNDDFTMEYTIAQEGGRLIVDFSYAFQKSVYPKDSYFTLKFYYNELVKKANEKIVLAAIAKP